MQARMLYHKSILAQAPCIGAVCPGLVGREQLQERLLYDAFIEQATYNGGTLVSFAFRNPDPKVLGDDLPGSGALVFSPNYPVGKEVLGSIFVNLPGLRLSTVLDVLGDPAEFLLITGCGMGNRIFGILLYPEKDILVTIHHELKRQEDQILKAETPVASPYYTTSADFQELQLKILDESVLDSVAFDLGPGVDDAYLLNQIRPWPGIKAAPAPTVNLCPR